MSDSPSDKTGGVWKQVKNGISGVFFDAEKARKPVEVRNSFQPLADEQQDDDIKDTSKEHSNF